MRSQDSAREIAVRMVRKPSAHVLQLAQLSHVRTHCSESKSQDKLFQLPQRKRPPSGGADTAPIPKFTLPRDERVRLKIFEF
jgi:hypothetical protein